MTNEEWTDKTAKHNINRTARTDWYKAQLAKMVLGPYPNGVSKMKREMDAAWIEAKVRWPINP